MDSQLVLLVKTLFEQNVLSIQNPWQICSNNSIAVANIFVLLSKADNITPKNRVNRHKTGYVWGLGYR